MKKKILLILVILFSINTFSFSQETFKREWRLSELVSFIDLIQFVPQNVFEGIPVSKFKSFLLSLNTDDIKQLNIDAWYNDKYKYEECFMLWNLNYTKNKINKEVYEKYTYGFIMLLYLDGYLKH